MNNENTLHCSLFYLNIFCSGSVQAKKMRRGKRYGEKKKIKRTNYIEVKRLRAEKDKAT